MRSLGWAAVLVGLAGPWLQIVGGAGDEPLRFSSFSRYVMIGQAMQEGWSEAWQEASCPHLYMRVPWRLETALAGNMPAHVRTWAQAGRRPCAQIRLDSRGRAPRWPPVQLTLWPSLPKVALWLRAEGAQAACLQATANTDAPAPWRLLLGEGASVQWHAAPPESHDWRWPLSRELQPPDPVVTCEPFSASARAPSVCTITWPSVRARVILCGPALMAGLPFGPPRGWQLEEHSP